ALPDMDRRVLVARYLEERSLREVGACVGLGENAAHKRTARALEKLRRVLARRGFRDLPAAFLTGAVAGGSAASPAQAATWAAVAWSAATFPAPVGATSFATLIAMTTTNALWIGAAAATLLTSAVLTPVLLRQRADLAELRQR